MRLYWKRLRPAPIFGPDKKPYGTLEKKSSLYGFINKKVYYLRLASFHELYVDWIMAGFAGGLGYNFVWNYIRQAPVKQQIASQDNVKIVCETIFMHSGHLATIDIQGAYPTSVFSCMQSHG